jgi:urease accessory protein
MTTPDGMQDDRDDGGQSLLRLMAWLSPSFPVGAYTYSHGLEFAVEAELVTDEAGLANQVKTIVRQGSGRVDADLFRLAWQATVDNDQVELARIVELGQALRGTSEMALESSAQGAAFLTALRGAWQQDGSADQLAGYDVKDISYAVAVAVAAAGAGIALKPALNAFLHAVAANLISAGVRLIPLGQTAGQRVLAALEQIILEASSAALMRDADDIGSATPMVDWASMKHETQYTRLFRS